MECQSHQYTMRFLYDKGSVTKKQRAEPTCDSALPESIISVSSAFNRLLTYDCFEPLNLCGDGRSNENVEEKTKLKPPSGAKTKDSSLGISPQFGKCQYHNFTSADYSEKRWAPGEY